MFLFEIYSKNSANGQYQESAEYCFQMRYFLKIDVLIEVFGKKLQLNTKSGFHNFHLNQCNIWLLPAYESLTVLK